jgi:hypothetical protein
MGHLHAPEGRIVIGAQHSHRIQSQHSKVSQIVIRQSFPSQVRVDAPKPPESCATTSMPREVRDKDASLISHDNKLDVSTTVDENADLPSNFDRNIHEKAGDLGSDNLLGVNSASIDAFDSLCLAGFETGLISVNSDKRDSHTCCVFNVNNI